MRLSQRGNTACDQGFDVGSGQAMRRRMRLGWRTRGRRPLGHQVRLPGRLHWLASVLSRLRTTKQRVGAACETAVAAERRLQPEVWRAAQLAASAPAVGCGGSSRTQGPVGVKRDGGCKAQRPPSRDLQHRADPAAAAHGRARKAAPGGEAACENLKGDRPAY